MKVLTLQNEQKMIKVSKCTYTHTINKDKIIISMFNGEK
jgi:hypothetical protein